MPRQKKTKNKKQQQQTESNSYQKQKCQINYQNIVRFSKMSAKYRKI